MSVSIIGDTIFAVFGMAEPSGEDAANALRCAQRMIATLDVWNSERKQQGETPLAFGIGLNSEPAAIGDVGSEQSLSFTIIGDTVNTASRCKGLRAAWTLRSSPPKRSSTRLRRRRRRTQRNFSLDCASSLRGRSAPVRVWT